MMLREKNMRDDMTRLNARAYVAGQEWMVDGDVDEDGFFFGENSDGDMTYMNLIDVEFVIVTMIDLDEPTGINPSLLG